MVDFLIYQLLHFSMQNRKGKVRFKAVKKSKSNENRKVRISPFSSFPVKNNICFKSVFQSSAPKMATFSLTIATYNPVLKLTIFSSWKFRLTLFIYIYTVILPAILNLKFPSSHIQRPKKVIRIFFFQRLENFTILSCFDIAIGRMAKKNNFLNIQEIAQKQGIFIFELNLYSI